MSPRPRITDKSNSLPPRSPASRRVPVASKLRTNRNLLTTLPVDQENNPFHNSIQSTDRIPLADSPTNLTIHAKINPFGLNGSWHKYEGLAFLEGLETFGPGRWKKIAKLVPTRDNIQIKSRAQQILRKQKKGVPIFDDLKHYRRGNPILIHTNYQLFMGCGLPSGQSMLSACPPPRPASDVLQAACGLAMLEERPLIFPDSYFGPNPPSTAYLGKYLSGNSSNNNNKF